MTKPSSLGDAITDRYARRGKPAKQERWAPGADPLEGVRRMAAAVDASPAYADTLNARDRAAVQTFIARREHLKANADGDDAA